MNITRILGSMAAVAILIGTTGCFRVSSDTRALRDVALKLETGETKEKIEVGAGFFTVGLAKLGTRFVDMPPEARSMLGSVDGLECSIHEIRDGQSNFAEVLSQADEMMTKRGSERVLGMVGPEQLIAIYVPRTMNTHRDVSASVMILTKRELICASASGDLDPVMEMALAKAQEQFPKAEKVAGNL